MVKIVFPRIDALYCSDSRAQVDDEDAAIMNLIRPDDWVLS